MVSDDLRSRWETLLRAMREAPQPPSLRSGAVVLAIKQMVAAAFATEDSRLPEIIAAVENWLPNEVNRRIEVWNAYRVREAAARERESIEVAAMARYWGCGG